MSTQDDTIEKKKVNERVPSKYKVIFLNDDFTPMELVVELLMQIFRHDRANAEKITMEVHNTGSATAGIYSYEIAEQKGLETVARSRSQGYPLSVTLEQE